jgi:hypothetical protein
MAILYFVLEQMLFIKYNRLVKIVRFLFILLLLLVFNQNSFSQSDNYWSWNFNTMSMLMAGSVVGGSPDASSIYYNPSLITWGEGPSLTLSASLITVQSYRAENIAGDGIDLNKIFLKIQPRFISFNFRTRNEKLNIEVSLFTPVSEGIDYTLQHFDSLDLIERTEGVETYSGYLNYSRKYDDLYIGLGGSYHITDKLSVGSSLFVSIKTMKYEYRKLASAYQDADTVFVDDIPEPRYLAESRFEESLNYWDLSLVLKLGAHYNLLNDRIGIGVNFTFPNIPVYGLANVRKSLARSNVYDNFSDTFTSNSSFIGVEENSKTRIKSPFSAAFGVQFSTKSGRSTLSFTMEYFHQIGSYALFESDFELEEIPDPWPGRAGPANLMSYSYQSRAVTNFAMGIKQFVSPSLQFMGGFRTDFTNGDGDNIRFSQNAIKIIQAHVDKYHITLGPVIKLRKALIVTGVQYSFGRNDHILQAINYSDPVEFNPLTEHSLEGVRQKNSNVIIDGLSLFLGVTIKSEK